jgi:putative tryptophan/tyrosine transport system substrate-binding protein
LYAISHSRHGRNLLWFSIADGVAITGSMQRREFIGLLGGAAAAWPLAAWAQGSQQVRRVSVLLGLDEKDPEATSRVKGFRLGMRDLGWVEGRNVQIEYRFAGSNLESIKEQSGVNK